MRYAIALLVFLTATQSVTFAGFADFTEYSAVKTFFAEGEVFQSGDLFFKATDSYPPFSNGVIILVSGGFHSLVPGPGVEFLLPAGTQEVSISYNDGSGTVMLINGVEPPFPPGEIPSFSLLDGLSAAGVSFETHIARGIPGSEGGVFTMRGPIDTLSFVGVELFFNEISVIVPEPTSFVLLVSASLLLAPMRRAR